MNVWDEIAWGYEDEDADEQGGYVERNDVNPIELYWNSAHVIRLCIQFHQSGVFLYQQDGECQDIAIEQSLADDKSSKPKEGAIIFGQDGSLHVNQQEFIPKDAKFTDTILTPEEIVALFLKGAQGNQGLEGFQGVNGNRGIQGNQGSVGEQGKQGNQGKQGTAGTTGTTGNRGFQGNQGGVGATGTNGHQGKQGGAGGTGTAGHRVILFYTVAFFVFLLYCIVLSW